MAGVRRRQSTVYSFAEIFFSWIVNFLPLHWLTRARPPATDRGTIRWFMLTSINRAHYFPGNRQADAPPCRLFSGHNWFFFSTLSGSRLNHTDVFSSKRCLWCPPCERIKYRCWTPEHIIYLFAVLFYFKVQMCHLAYLCAAYTDVPLCLLLGMHSFQHLLKVWCSLLFI